MHITFLMGNGFDIGIGLKTGYDSFYKKYCDTLYKNNENIKNFKRMLRNRNAEENKKIINWADFEKAFGQHAIDFTVSGKKAYIERFENFVFSFNEYLEKEEKKADFSNEEYIAKTMNTAVNTYFNIRSQDKESLLRILNSLSDSYTYSFVSFNYTRSVDKCVQIFKRYLGSDHSRKVDKILHIHGYVEENMIMGVNDPSQIANSSLASDNDIIREIVKPRQNADIRSNYEKQLIETINSSDVICIYGMSIGETDKKWWKYIAGWLSKNPKHALVILKYEKQYDKRFPFTQNIYIDSVVNTFLSLSEQPESVKDAIRPRIFVGMNHNIFAMNLCNEEKRQDIPKIHAKYKQSKADKDKSEVLEEALQI